MSNIFKCLIIGLFLNPFTISAQSKKKQLIVNQQKIDSLTVVRSSSAGILDQVRRQCSISQSELQELAKQIKEENLEIARLQGQMESYSNRIEYQRNSLSVLKQISIYCDSIYEIGEAIQWPIENISFRSRYIDILQIDTIESLITFVYSDSQEYANTNLTNWTWVIADQLEYERLNLEESCSCSVKVASLADLIMSKYEIPSEAIENGVIFTNEGVVYTDRNNPYSLIIRSVSGARPKSLKGYVAFTYQIQL